MAAHTPLPALYRDPRVGDLIIRTSDSIEFHVYKAIIAGASSVFADMVSLAQPSIGELNSSVKPDVDVAEDSVIWERLLRLCYAPGPPALEDYNTLNALRAVLDATIKYQMDVALECASRALLFPQFVEKMPFDVYALACVYKLPVAARAAARHSLRLPIYYVYSKELGSLELPLRAYGHISEYRRECAAVAQAFVSTRSSRSSISPSREYKFIRLPGGPLFKPDGIGCNSPACFTTSYDVMQSPLHIDTPYTTRSAAMQYLRTLHTQLEFLPDAGLALSEPLLKSIIDPALGCPACVRVIHAHVATFSAALHKALEDAISRVELVVDT